MLSARAVQQRLWMVRLASALALGECKAAKNTEVLRDLLQDPYRPVRIGAAAAIWASGGEVEAEPPSLLDTPEVTPKQIGDLHDSIDWLTRLAGAYAGVLSSWKRHEGAQRSGADSGFGPNSSKRGQDGGSVRPARGFADLPFSYCTFFRRHLQCGFEYSISLS